MAEFRICNHCRTSNNSGQAMVETVVIMLVTLFLLFGLLQIAHAFAGREILRHAAARAARARTVGFNYWMCNKVMRVAAIPVAGKMIEPKIDIANGELQDALSSKKDGELWDWSLSSHAASERAVTEAARIPEYLGSENDARADYILDYEGWDDISASGLGGGTASPIADDNTLTVRVKQDYPLSVFIRALNDWVGYVGGGKDGPKSITLQGEYNIEDHYSLNLEDQNF